ncbi:uncharacterized protein LOC125011092 [Mugil cephalus]|uniref:uncharacterized protein LOC125011092 n=1 Tax=Mugil cephalus TaxID=48193 RepID=UPI001FB7561A|nr:uncharacterized protein LOC125011092 [Mugil cephalus]
MGNIQCPGTDAVHLAAFARDFCPFPTYMPSTHLINMLSINSSIQLKEHYMAVQTSLNPKQQEDFAQRLRTTFGREGRVTYGGVGVVALSLSFLFDTLARQVRGESVPDSGLIPGLFLKDPRGYYPQNAHTVSTYLRLVPYIANNPTRMKEETERYVRQLTPHNSSSVKEDIAKINEILMLTVEGTMKVHLLRLKNGTADELESYDDDDEDLSQNKTTFNLNCVPEEADKEFLAKVQQADNRTKETFDNCKPDTGEVPETLMHHVAELEWTRVMFGLAFVYKHAISEEIFTHREDFDLKANSLVKWAE